MFYDFVGEKLGTFTGDDGTKIEIDETFITTDATLYGALYVVTGAADDEKKFHEHIRSYVKRSYKHYKPIGITARAQRYLDIKSAPGVIFAANNPNFAEEFITAITQQRFWNRKI